MIRFIRLSAIMAFLILTSGCMAKKPEPVVVHCPRIQLPPDPPIYALQLNEKSTPNQVVQAWAATAFAYYNWNLAVHQQVEFSR